MRRLPSLNGLRAFEAAARLGSFVAAGEELNVTQAAISRLVRHLEDRLAFGCSSACQWPGAHAAGQGAAARPHGRV
jgi:hypothetical protein